MSNTPTRFILPALLAASAVFTGHQALAARDEARPLGTGKQHAEERVREEYRNRDKELEGQGERKREEYRHESREDKEKAGKGGDDDAVRERMEKREEVRERKEQGTGSEAGKGSEQGQESREEHSRKWWRFWEN